MNIFEQITKNTSICYVAHHALHPAVSPFSHLSRDSSVPELNSTKTYSPARVTIESVIGLVVDRLTLTVTLNTGMIGSTWSFVAQYVG